MVLKHLGSAQSLEKLQINEWEADAFYDELNRFTNLRELH